MKGFDVKRNRRALVAHPVTRILIIWVIQTLALLALTFLLSGLRVDSIGVALIAAAVIGLLNAFLWPLLSHVLLPFAVLTLGLLALVVNGETVREGSGANVLGDPMHAFVWLVNALTRDGITVKAGQVHNTGTATDIYWAKAGDRVEARYGAEEERFRHAYSLFAMQRHFGLGTNGSTR